MESLLFALRMTSALSTLVLAFGAITGFFTPAAQLGFTCLLAGSSFFILSYGANLYLERENF